MAEPTTVTPTAPATESAPRGRLTREALLMLVLPPVVVLLVFGAWVWWRQTTDLDVIEANQLRWSEIRSLLVEHVQLTVVTSLIVVGIAVPLGIVLTRRAFRAAAPVVVGIANAGQAAPSVGLIVLLFLWLNDWLSGFWIAVIALSLYGILPVLRNTITGIEGVDPTLVEAGRGVGMTTFGTLFRIELQLALPVIMAGVRTSLVLVVGTASLACFINAGGLGEMIITGITLFKYSLMISGALLVALLALVFEWLGRVLELLTRPRGI
ncbi:osmoprotectant transport system permease protein [Nocardioides sp. J9]|uniref:ABC transporter permease n=1 Tax=unclassified Nocardioides TaxID=2615069 RepID=UPI0004B51C65|nr:MULTISPECIES: ABC transporter permease [unclassified Nocardioides]TWH01983.1 osmoprotectant transport system permease protein [Nocardioides sp. J9]